MKLRMYQQGGGLIYTPFIGEKGLASPVSSNNSGSSEDKIDPMDKELISMFKDQNLLPSDIDYITKQLNKFYKNSSSLYNVSDSDSYHAMMPSMLKIMNSVSKAKFNKQQNDKVVEKMIKEDAGGELAMDSYGKIYIQDEKGDIKKVTARELYESQGELIPLSNSQLINYRQRYLGMDGNILNDLENIVGKKSIATELDDIISKYGTTENVAMLSKDAAVQNLLIDMNSPEGIYKVTEKYQVKDIENAAAALYRRLPKNMQDAMKADAAYNGLDPEKEVWRMIMDTIKRNTDQSIQIDYDATASKAAGVGGEGGSSKTVKDTYPERLVSDPLTPTRYTRIQTSDSGVALYAYAQDAGPIMDKDEKTMIGNSTLSNIFNNTAVGSVVDRNSILFGSRILNPGDFDKVVYDSSVNMQRVWLPTYTNASGQTTPDLGAMRKVNEIRNEINNTYSHDGVVNEAAINDWLSRNGINAHWDNESRDIVFNSNVMRPYLVIKGIGSDKVVSEDKTWLHDAENDPSERESSWNIYNNTTGEDLWTGWHSLWTGNIYMPLRSSELATFIYNDEYYPQERYMNLAEKLPQERREREAQSGIISNFTQ